MQDKKNIKTLHLKWTLTGRYWHWNGNEPQKSLHTGWLFQMSYQNPQLTGKQNFYNHFHTKPEQYNSFSLYMEVRHQHKTDSNFLINANFLCNKDLATTTMLWNAIRGYTLYYLGEDIWSNVADKSTNKTILTFAFVCILSVLVHPNAYNCYHDKRMAS